MIKRLKTIIKNFFFCLKYPFYKSRNVWDDHFLGYDSTWYDAIPEGWQKAFGKQLSDELRAALIKDKMLWKFRFMEIKEKYGTLRLYSSFQGPESGKVLQKYELLSMAYCINCGRPVRYATSGWIYYLCDECFADKVNMLKFKNEKEKAEYIKQRRLTVDDIPIINCYDKGDLDLKAEYNIDFIELWGIK